MRFSSFLLLACLSICQVTSADVVVDLTTAGASGFIGDAFFQQNSNIPGGTGNTDVFAQIANSSSLVVEGYNTEVNNTFDNGSSNTHNRSITIADVPLVDLGGTLYREFFVGHQRARHWHRKIHFP